jgi:hypothetical protein
LFPMRDPYVGKPVVAYPSDEVESA